MDRSSGCCSCPQPEHQAIPKASRLTHIALMVGTLALAGLILSPLFSPILWAVVLVYALYPLYGLVLRVTGGRESLSAFLLCAIMTIGFLLPLFYLTLLVAQDLAGMVSSLVTYLQQGELSVGEGWRRYPVIAGFVAQFQNLERLTGSDLQSSLVAGVADLGKLLIQQSTNVVSNVVQWAIEFGIVLLSAFYFFRDGRRFVDWTQENLPIAPERRRLVLTRFDEVVKGRVRQYDRGLAGRIHRLVGILVGGITVPDPVGGRHGYHGLYPLRGCCHGLGSGCDLFGNPGSVYASGSARRGGNCVVRGGR